MLENSAVEEQSHQQSSRWPAVLRFPRKCVRKFPKIVTVSSVTVQSQEIVGVLIFSFLLLNSDDHISINVSPYYHKLGYEDVQQQ